MIMKADSARFFLEELIAKEPSRFFVIIDENVKRQYDMGFLKNCDRIVLYPFQSSEKNKTMDEVVKIHSVLLSEKFTTADQIINIGGGIISDIGGFVAHTFKRGMRFINIPTTLLAMIDAAHGGKNGVNLGNVKNAIGSFQFPEDVFVTTDFLSTLPAEELVSGFGELIKYALIADREMWNDILALPTLSRDNLSRYWIDRCIVIKRELVKQDFQDKHIRRVLNFGHTVGHALESFFLSGNEPLLHGHAVALGICCEAYLSSLHHFITKEEVCKIREVVRKFFPVPEISPASYSEIIRLMRLDKKIENHEINIVLLKSIGEAIPNQYVAEDEIVCALEFLGDTF